VLLNLSDDKRRQVITKHWNVIKNSILASLPENEQVNENLLLKHALTGQLECWFVVRENKGINEIIGILTTVINNDLFASSKSMIVYSIYNLKEETAELDIWNEEFERFEKYARSKGCKKIIAYSDNPRIIEVVKKLGWNISYFLKFNLGV
jgi:hypothetical protein